MCLGIILGPWLILALIFGEGGIKKKLLDYLDFIKGFPLLTLILTGWAIFWMIPIMLILTILDLLFWKEIFVNIGFLSRLLLSALALYFIRLWYYFGIGKYLERKKKNAESE